MKVTSIDYSVEITGTDKICPTGETAGNRYMKEGKIPVLSCEGACIRGEIARLAAHLVAKEEPYRRGCHGELLTVPGSALAQWITKAEKIVLIDGCFLHCHGRIFENLIGEKKLVQFDALSYYGKYSEHFDIDAVPEGERAEAAWKVADAVLVELSGMTDGNRGRTGLGCGGAVASEQSPRKAGCGCS